MTMTSAAYKEPIIAQADAPGEGPTLEVINLQKSYGRARRALDGVTVSFPPGLTGLLGPNGAGKSTLMRCIAGVENWDSGDIRIRAPWRGRGVRQSIGYMPESVAFPGELRVRDFLRFVCEAKGARRGWREEVDAKVEATGLTPVAKRVIGSLSKGYRQRLGLAQAMIGDPPILVLDEPVSSLDPLNLIEVRRTIRDYARSACVIVSTHQLAEATALCDRVVLLDQGTIAFDGPMSELGRGTRRLFEVEVLVADHEALHSWMLRTEGAEGGRPAGDGGTLILTLAAADERQLADHISALVDLGCGIVGVRPARDALEAAFAAAVASASPVEGIP